MKRFLARLLLGRGSEYFDLIQIKGKLYRINIQPYVSVEGIMEIAANNGVFAAEDSKLENE